MCDYINFSCKIGNYSTGVWKQGSKGFKDIKRISGNIGIGTTSPASKLEVAGTFNATQGTTSFRVTSDNNIIVHLE